jgi:hypothetical protein
MDTLSDPFNGKAVFSVVFKRESEVLEKGSSVFFFVVATQPAASIHPTAIHRAQGTRRFIRDSITRRILLLDNSLSQGTEAMQSVLGITGRNPKEIEQVRNVPPLPRRKNVNIRGVGKNYDMEDPMKGALCSSL